MMSNGGTLSNPNPYVGPEPFRRDQHLYGRDAELRELKSLLIAERIVLLYSPSGAGKTSLIQAGLIPALEKEEFEVYPMIRFGHKPDTSALGCNPYILRVMLSLEESFPEESRLSFDNLASLSFVDYLKDRRQRQAAGDASVMIFDQFEEILTLDPFDHQAKRDFFHQIGVALRDPGIWALFSMREDHVAALEPYLMSIPTRLKSTFRLGLLTPEGAQCAIQQPAKEWNVEFTDEAVTRLVDDLRQVLVQEISGNVVQRLGQYVEPVHLQVVCCRIWENLPPGSIEVRPEQNASIGGVDSALAGFYADRVKEVAARTGVKESVIREWFDRKLITESGIRGEVMEGPQSTEGLDNAVIRMLEDMHLVRGEERRGVTWLELCHDRMLKPIRKDNRTWFEQNLSALQTAAAFWNRNGRQEKLCLMGQKLSDAERWASENPDEVTGETLEFLIACKGSRKNHRWRKISYLLVVGIMIVGTVTGYVIFQKNAQDRKSRASILAIRARGLLDKNIDLAILLAQKARELEPENREIDGVAMSVALWNPRLSGFLHEHRAAVDAISFSPDGKTLATGDYHGNVILWEIKDDRTFNKLKHFPPSGSAMAIRGIALSPNGTYMGVCNMDHSIVLYDLKSGEKEVLQSEEDHPEDKQAQNYTFIRNVWSLAISSDSKLMASCDGMGRVLVWDIATKNHTPKILQPSNENAVRCIAFGRDDKILVAGGKTGEIMIWERNGDTWARINGFPDYRRETVTKGQPYDATITGIAFSPDRKRIATGNREGQVNLWDVETRKPIGNEATSSNRHITSVAFCSKGVISASYDGTLCLWSEVNMRQIGRPFTGHVGWVLAVAASPDPKNAMMVSGGIDRKVLIWDINLPDSSPDSTDTPKSKAHFAFSPDGSYESASYENGDVFLRCRKDGRYTKIANFPSGVDRFAFSRNSAFLAISGALSDKDNPQKLVKIFDLTKPDVPVWELPADKDAIHALSANGQELAICDRKRMITFWSIPEKEKKGEPIVVPNVKSDKYIPVAIEYSPDSRYLVVGSDEDKTFLWILASRECTRLPDLHNGIIRSVAFSSDGKILATASRDNAIILWGIDAPKHSKSVPVIRRLGSSLVGHQGTVDEVAFSSDGKLLASAGSDRSVILWDVENQQQVGPPLSGYTDTQQTLCFVGKDRRLCIGSCDGDTRELDLDIESLTKRSCMRANRTLTDEEWKLHMGETKQRSEKSMVRCGRK